MAKRENKKKGTESTKNVNVQNKIQVNEELRSPQEILEEFENLSVDVDMKLTGNTNEINKQVLEDELERANAAEEELKKIIETTEKNEQIKKTFTKFWNGSSDGWFN